MELVRHCVLLSIRRPLHLDAYLFGHHNAMFHVDWDLITFLAEASPAARSNIQLNTPITGFNETRTSTRRTHLKWMWPDATP